MFPQPLHLVWLEWFMKYSLYMGFLLWAVFALWACESPPTSSPLTETPSADAGQDLRSQVRDLVILDGTDSKAPDNSSLNYSWVQVEGPSISIQNAGSGRAQVTPGQEGVYVFRLTVTDGQGLSAADEMVLQVTDPTGGKPSDNTPNTAPVARAGRDLQAEIQEAVLLDGSGSSDAEDASLEYAWVQIEGPPLIIQGAASSQAMIVAGEVGEYVFRLTVTDSQGLSATDSMRLLVRRSHTDGVLKISAAPIGADVVRVQYTIASADLDTLQGDLLITADQKAQKTLLSIKPGRDRLVELFAYDQSGRVVAFGSALIALAENETIELVIEMQALRIPRGSIEVEAVFEGVGGGG